MLAGLLAWGGGPSGAASKVWTGASSTTWSTSGNWNSGGAPGASDVAVFNSTSSNKNATITGSTSIGALSIQPGYTGTITINSGVTLSAGNVSINDGLIGYWRFDESSAGTALDASGHGNDLTHQGSPTSTTSVATMTLRNPRAMTLTATSNQYAGITSFPDILKPTAWTISAWINHNSNFEAGAQGSEVLDINNNIGLRIEDHSALRVFRWNSTAGHDHCQSSTVDLTGTGWHHVVGSFSGSTFKIYIDGTDITSGLSGTCTGNMGQSFSADVTYPVRIGSKRGDSTVYDFDGSIDEVRVYNRVLSATEVEYLASGQHLPTQSSAVTIAGTGNLDIAGDLTINSRSVSFSAATNVTVAGSLYTFGGTTTGSATITLDGSGTQEVGGLGGPIHAFTVNGSATWTLIDRLQVAGTLSMSGGTFDISNRVVRLGRLGQTAGTLTSTGSTVVIESASNQNVAASSTLGTLRFEDPTESNLVAYWKFDDLTGGTALDSSSTANHAPSTVDRPTWLSTGASAITFENGGAVQFDGSDDYFAPSTSGIPSTTSAMTIATWVNYPNLGTARTMLEFLNGSGQGIRFGFSSGSNFQVYGATASNMGSPLVGVNISNTTTYPLNTWRHFAYTYDGTNHTLYINGSQAATTTNAAVGGAPSSVRIGNRSTNAEYFNGKLDDMRVYDTALSAAQISRLAAGKHADTGGTATYTLTAATATSGDFIIDSGTVASGPQAISVGGSWTNDAYSYSGTGTVSFTSTSTGKTITSNGQQFGAVSFTGSGGGWTLTDRLWSAGALSLSNGTFNTGNFVVHAGTVNRTGGTLTLGSSTVVVDSLSSQTLTSSTAFNTLRIEPTFETGLVAYWKLDDSAESSVRNSAGSGNVGALAGDTNWYTASLPMPLNKFDNAAALIFDGTTDYVDISSLTSIPAVNGTFSVSLWANWDNDGNSDEFIELMNGASGVRIGTTGNRVSVRRGNGSTVLIQTGTNAYSDGNWHHVVYTFTSTGPSNKLYVDGNAITPTSTAADAVTPNAIRIGAHSDGSWSFAGKLDDIRIYNVELTAAEVANLYSGNYAGRGGGATFTLGTDTTASNLQVDSGTLAAAGGNDITVNGTTTASEVKAGAGLTIGGSAGVFSHNLQVDGTLTMNATSGSLSIANTRSLLINGSLVTSTGTSTPKPTIKSVSGTYTFSIGTAATATPALNINGLAVRNTTAAGMFINQTSGATTTFTRFDNIDFSAGTAGTPSYLLHIAHNTLTLHANGLSFDTTGTNATTNVYLEDRNGAGNDVRMYIGGTCVANEDDCEAYDLDDDTAGVLGTTFDGVPDDAGNDGSVVQWLYRSYSDVGGTIESFPAVAFNWNTFAYRGTYVLTNNTSGGDLLIKRDTDGALYHASATWSLPMGEDFKGRPLWIHDTSGGVYYVYVLSTAGRVYKLRDDGNSFTALANFRDGGSATGASPLSADTTHLYWTGLSGTGVASAFKLPQSNLMGASSVAINAATAAPSLATISATKYLFTAAATRAYKINTDFSPASSTVLTNTTVHGRVTVVANRVHFIDDSGKVWVRYADTMAEAWSYVGDAHHGAGTPGSCTSASNCEARNFSYDITNNRVYYGDKDGHIYAVAQNGTGGQLLWATPYDTGSDVYVNSPLYRAGVIAIGSTAGKVYFIDQRSTSADAPSGVAALIRTYNFGSVAINSISFDHDGNQYVIATSDGKLYYVAASLVADPTNSWN